MNIRLVLAASVMATAVSGYGAKAVFATDSASAFTTGSTSQPPACAPPATPNPPALKPTTVTTIGQAYYCIFAHYYSGPVLDDRALLVPAFSALTQELQRLGADQADASLPAFTGNRDADWAAFAAVYTKIDAALPTAAARQAVAAATMRGMIGSLRDDHARWERGPVTMGALSIMVSGMQGAEPDPAATAPLFVTSVLNPGLPVRPGDEIVTVNGVPPYTGGKLNPGVLDEINNATSPVTLVLHRPSTGKNLTVTLRPGVAPIPAAAASATPTASATATATPVPVPSGVSARLLNGDIAYVQLPDFATGRAAQVLAAIAKLGTGRTLRGVILDLRGNTGGDPAEDAKLLGAWVHGKAWNYFCDIRWHCTADYTSASTPLLHLPLVALTDRGCASACDAFAATVKDLHLGTLVGTRTAGAASGPGAGYALNDGSLLGLPSKHALMADKEIIDTIGVAPDYFAPMTAGALSRGHDPAVAKALSLLG